jgi:hypothetical protein
MLRWDVERDEEVGPTPLLPCRRARQGATHVALGCVARGLACVNFGMSSCSHYNWQHVSSLVCPQTFLARNCLPFFTVIPALRQMVHREALATQFYDSSRNFHP